MEPVVDLGPRFTALRRVAVGGMSEVWLAKDEVVDGLVTVKGPAPGLDPEVARQALDREAAALDRLDHVGVAEMVERFDVGETPYLALEWFEGESLTSWRGRPVEKLIGPLIGVAETLRHVHDRGIVHRDVKSRNIIMTEDGRPALIDFGISSFGERGSATVRGGGTRGHASPQQLAGEPPSPADDLYAFGAMMDVLSTEREREESPQTEPPAGSPEQARGSEGPVPDGFRELMSDLLALEPAERPAGFEEVVNRLEEIRRDLFEVTRPPSPAISTPGASTLRQSLPPVRIRQPDMRPVSQKRTSRRSWIGLAAIVVGAGVLGLGLFGAFWMLPRWVSEQPATASEQPLKPGAPVVANDLKPRLAEALTEVEQKWRGLTDRSVGRWAPDRSRDVSALLETARDHFEGGVFNEAEGAITQVRDACSELEQEAKSAAERAISEGRAFLAAADPYSAKASFDLALLADPEAVDAQRGLEQAASLREALRLLEKAAELERSGDTAAAAELYRKVAKMAPQLGEANRALARLHEQHQESAYAEVLSEGLVALDSGDWATAEDALNSAGTLKPGAPEIEDALLRLQARRRLENVEALERVAEGFEHREAWLEAQATYDKILDVAPATASAERGRRRAQERAELDQKLVSHLAHPDRLAEPAVLNDAKAVLKAAETTSPRGPRLISQVERLASHVRTMSTPMIAELFSDGETQVTIYRVGHLGVFERKAVELTPGTYTIVGSRRGFRDVRLTLVVKPGEVPKPLNVRCEESL